MSLSAESRDGHVSPTPENGQTDLTLVESVRNDIVQDGRLAIAGQFEYLNHPKLNSHETTIFLTAPAAGPLPTNRYFDVVRELVRDLEPQSHTEPIMFTGTTLTVGKLIYSEERATLVKTETEELHFKSPDHVNDSLLLNDNYIKKSENIWVRSRSVRRATTHDVLVYVWPAMDLARERIQHADDGKGGTKDYYPPQDDYFYTKDLENLIERKEKKEPDTLKKPTWAPRISFWRGSRDSQ